MPVVRVPYPLWTLEKPAKDRYELVMIVAIRSKQVNENRLKRQNILGIPVEEAQKPTTKALEELKEGFVAFNYRETHKPTA